MSLTLKQLEKTSKALGDANRLKILHLIAQQGGTGQCAVLQECVELAQPSISHHIKILLEAGLIEATKEGRNYKYSLLPESIKAYLTAIESTILQPKE